jgi:hypothetical protein
VGCTALSSQLAEVFLGQFSSVCRVAIETADDVGRLAIGKKDEAARRTAQLEDLGGNLHGHMLIGWHIIEKIEGARERTRNWFKDEFPVPVGGGESAIHKTERNLVLYAGDRNARGCVTTEFGKDFLLEGQHGSNALSSPERTHRRRAVRLATSGA